MMADAAGPRDASIREFLTALASTDSHIGAVSAAAVTGGMGASLLVKVAALPTTKSDALNERTALLRAGASLDEVQEQLLEAAETEALVKLFAARNMPQASEAEQARRQAAIQLALRAGADVPLEVMRLCALGLRHAQTIAAASCRAAGGDVEFGVALLRVAATAARSNLEARLSSLTDLEYVRALVEQIAHLSEEVTAAARTAESSTQPPPA